MSNTSWKQYGGRTRTDKFHNITIGTLVADQVILREAVSSITIFDTSVTIGGYLEVSEYIKAANGNIIGHMNVGSYLNVGTDLTVNDNLYFNGKNVYLYKNRTEDKLGLNTHSARTIFDITAPNNTATDILTVRSNTSSIRNIIAENVNDKGIVVSANGSNSSIEFFNSGNTNASNRYDSKIMSSSNGTFTIDASYNIFTSTGTTVINSITSLDISSNTTANIRSNSAMKILSNSTTDISSISTMNINSNTLLNIIAPDTKIYTRLHITNRNTQTNIFDETLVLYDTSCGNYLYDTYENTTYNTGKAMTMVTYGNTSNTFMNIVTPSKLGLSLG
jgi:hypothetical protein